MTHFKNKLKPHAQTETRQKGKKWSKMTIHYVSRHISGTVHQMIVVFGRRVR